MHWQRIVEITKIRQTWINDTGANLRFFERGKLTTSRALEIRELHDRDRRLGIATQVTLGWRQRRHGDFVKRDRLRLIRPHRIPNADSAGDAKQQEHTIERCAGLGGGCLDHVLSLSSSD